MLWHSVPQMLRQIQDRHARAEEQRCLQAQRHLIMQQVLPPVGHDKFRHDHRQRILRMTQVHRVNLGQQRT